jgi:DNA-binding response OmpR family regulator
MADKSSMARVCVIGEADPFVAQLLQRFAEESGLRALRAQVGQEVVTLVRQANPSVIILEPELPGTLRGWEAAQALSADETVCAVPVVACSWLKEAEARELLGHLNGYLQKPDLHYEDFVAALAEAGVEIGERLDPPELTA